MKGPLFSNERLILVGGPGGVGKTTLAATLGIEMARQGHKTVVLTVDPARRLAQALGLAGFKEELQKVDLPPDYKGSLMATMLDTQRYFDRIIGRLARSDDQRDKILNNPIYQTMVESLGGTQEYAAMERLFEFAQDPTYTRIVVDTPPTQNAIDLLNAPQRLAEFMDNSVLKWFQGPKPAYLKLFQHGTKVAMKLLQKVFGAEFLGEFNRLMDDIEGMQSGFRKTHLDVIELLRSKETAFLLVTVPSHSRLQESVSFHKSLLEQHIRLSGVVMNRLERECPDMVKGSDDANVEDWLKYQSALYREQKKWAMAFHDAFQSIAIKEIPVQTGNLHDVAHLSQLGRLLID